VLRLLCIRHLSLLAGLLVAGKRLRHVSTIEEVERDRRLTPSLPFAAHKSAVMPFYARALCSA
jgi:hypothetical protein